MVEETLVEEQEEGELAHLSWVRNYDRPLPQVENHFSNSRRRRTIMLIVQEIMSLCFPNECKVCEVKVKGETFSVKLQRYRSHYMMISHNTSKKFKQTLHVLCEHLKTSSTSQNRPTAPLHTPHVGAPRITGSRTQPSNNCLFLPPAFCD